MNKPIKSTFVSAVFLFVILALSIVYLVDYRIREAAYQHHQVDQVLIQKKNDVFDDFNRHVSPQSSAKRQELSGQFRL